MAETESETRDEKAAVPAEKEAAAEAKASSSSFPAPAPAPAPAPGKSAGRIVAASSSPREAIATGGPLAAYEALTRSAKLADLVAITTQVVAEAGVARRAAWNTLSTVSAAAEEAKLTRADAETPFGN